MARAAGYLASMLTFLWAMASAAELRAEPLSAAMPQGIGGLIGNADPAVEALAWRRLRSTDVTFARYLAAAAPSEPSAQDLRRRFHALERLEARLIAVVELGAAAPALAALARLGSAYEATHRWLVGDAPAAEGSHLVYPWRERAVAAYTQVLERGYEVGAHGTEPVLYARSRLQILRPEDYPMDHERLPPP